MSTVQSFSLSILHLVGTQSTQLYSSWQSEMERRMEGSYETFMNRAYLIGSVHMQWLSTSSKEVNIFGLQCSNLHYLNISIMDVVWRFTKLIFFNGIMQYFFIGLFCKFMLWC